MLKYNRNALHLEDGGNGITPDTAGICFTALANNSTVALVGAINITDPGLMQYSRDGIIWTDYHIIYWGYVHDSIVLQHVGDKLYFRNKSTTPTAIANVSTWFETSGNLSVSGDIMSLLSKNRTQSFNGCSLPGFGGNSGTAAITDITGITLPSITENGCYSGLFGGLTAITETPVLPATVLSQYCYRSMFEGCTSLTTVHLLSNPTLAKGCYYEMFKDCTSLVNAPSLNNTTLEEACYFGMFSGCTSLVVPPTLPATTLAASCYREMFMGCTSLASTPSLSVTTLAYYCYESMFYGCTSLTAPCELPATSMAIECYRLMFYGCSNIRLSTTQDSTYTIPYRIPTTGTGSDPWNTTLELMFGGTGGTFTGTPVINTTYYLAQPSAAAGIYRNSSSGLISLSADGTNWITLADKNLGATVVYEDGDTLTPANTGYVYQRGNNYGFPSASDTSASITTSSTQVDASTYGPGNYYSSSTFILNTDTTSFGDHDWSNPRNDNLRGNYSSTVTDRQGPCPAGYHLLDYAEANALLNALSTLGSPSMREYLKMPSGVGRSRIDASAYGGNHYWMSQVQASGDAARTLRTSATMGDQYRPMALPIRPFKDTPVVPNSRWIKIY